MSRRHRLGVALLLDPPEATEVDGLRKALGDPNRGTVAPHLTLVAPVNVRAEQLSDAEEVLRRAAHAQLGPLALSLGPVAAFVTPGGTEVGPPGSAQVGPATDARPAGTASSVVYLAIGGEHLDELGRLHDASRAGPLLRPERFEWAPHVTLSAEAGPEVTTAALTALGDYRAVARFDRVVLMEEVERRWQPLADACLGPPAVVGRGGLELEITEGRLLGPEAAELVRAEAKERAAGEWPTPPPDAATVVLTARREAHVVGVAAAWAARRPGAAVHAGVLVASDARRQGVGRALLRALEACADERCWTGSPARGHGPENFFASCGAWARAGGLD